MVDTENITVQGDANETGIFGTRGMETKLFRVIYRDLTRQCEFRSLFLKNFD